MDDKKLAEALRLFVMENKYPTPARLLEAADRIEALTTQLAESERQRAALTVALIDCGYDDGSLCRHCAKDGYCNIEPEQYYQNKGACFVFVDHKRPGRAEDDQYHNV